MAHSLPLAESHAALGAHMSERQGWSVPARYADIDLEVRAVREGAGMLDLSDRGTLRVSGADRITFLQGQLSNDVAKTSSGRGCHATLLTRTGKLVSDLYLWNDAEAVWLDTEPERTVPTRDALDRFVISEDVVLEDRTSACVHLGVAGPKAQEALSRALGAPLAELENLAFMEVASGARVSRRRAAGADLFEVWLETESSEWVWDALRDAGAIPVGRDAWDLAALEAGEARWGLDVDESHIPLEANLGDAISYTKGCYVGQEVIAKATHLGRVNKRLVGLISEATEPLVHDDPIEVAGDPEPIGRITRGAHSPTLGRAIALGYVKWKHAEPGTELQVRRAGSGDSVAARVVKLPFFEALA